MCGHASQLSFEDEDGGVLVLAVYIRRKLVLHDLLGNDLIRCHAHGKYIDVHSGCGRGGRWGLLVCSLIAKRIPWITTEEVTNGMSFVISLLSWIMNIIYCVVTR